MSLLQWPSAKYQLTACRRMNLLSYGSMQGARKGNFHISERQEYKFISSALLQHNDHATLEQVQPYDNGLGESIYHPQSGTPWGNGKRLWKCLQKIQPKPFWLKWWFCIGLSHHQLLLPRFKMLTLKMDNRSGDPNNHMRNYKTTMKLHKVTKPWCMAFPTTLRKAPKDWFNSLALGSITSIKDLSNAFYNQFAKRKKRKNCLVAFHLLEKREKN